MTGSVGRRPLRIGIALFDGVEELDAVGPWEVLAFWAQHAATRTDETGAPIHEVEVVSVSQDDGRVVCAKGLQVLADHTWDTVGPLDVVVYPGGRGTRPQITDADVLGWVRAQAESGALMTSVCTGALVYAAAGLLDGRPATTHWGAVEHLERLAPDVRVDRDARFVDDGDVITAAGVSAGIDMALHLVARLAGDKMARLVRRGIQYDPAPPV